MPISFSVIEDFSAIILLNELSIHSVHVIVSSASGIYESSCTVAMQCVFPVLVDMLPK